MTTLQMNKGKLHAASSNVQNATSVPRSWGQPREVQNVTYGKGPGNDPFPGTNEAMLHRWLEQDLRFEPYNNIGCVVAAHDTADRVDQTSSQGKHLQ